MRRARLVLVLIGWALPLAIAPRGVSGEDRQSPDANPIDGPFVLGGAGERIDSLMEEFVATGFSGCVFVYRDGLVVLHGAYGPSDRRRDLPSGVGTLFPVGSMENEFLLAAILKLESDGRLTIDDAVLGAVDETRGTRAGAGGALRLAEIIERASGQSCERYIRESLFKRAGMARTIFGDPEAPGTLIASGHTGDRGAFRLFERAPWLFPILKPSLRGAAAKLVPTSPGASPETGALGIRSTVGDLFRWRLALQGEDFLGAKSGPRSREWLGDGERVGRASLQVGEMPAGYQLAILSDPGRHLIMVVAANNDLGWSVPVILAIEKRLYGGADTLLTFSVLGVCVAALFLALGVSQRGRRGRLGRRARLNPFPF